MAAGVGAGVAAVGRSVERQPDVAGESREPAGRHVALRRGQRHEATGYPTPCGPDIRPCRRPSGHTHAADRIVRMPAGDRAWCASWLAVRAAPCVLVSLLACGSADVSAAARAADERPGALGTIVLPGGVDALAEAAGLPVPRRARDGGLEVIRRLHLPADGNAAAAAQRRQAIEAAFDRAAAGGAAAAGDTIPLPFDEGIWARAIFSRKMPPGGLAPRSSRRRAPRCSTTAPSGSTTRPAPGSRPRPHRLLRIGATGRRLRRVRAEPAHRRRRAIASARRTRPLMQLWRSSSASRRRSPMPSSTSCSARRRAGSPGSTTRSAGSSPASSSTSLAGEDAVKRLRRLADVFDARQPGMARRRSPVLAAAGRSCRAARRAPGDAEGVLQVPLAATAWTGTLGADDRIDAAWLAGRVFLGDQARVRERFELVLFASRWTAGEHHGAGGGDPGALRATRRSLALTLERLGVRDDALAARLLAFITGPVPRRDAPTFRLLQASLALVEGARLAGTIDAAAAGRLLDGAGRSPARPRARAPASRPGWPSVGARVRLGDCGPRRPGRATRRSPRRSVARRRHRRSSGKASATSSTEPPRRAIASPASARRRASRSAATTEPAALG